MNKHILLYLLVIIFLLAGTAQAWQVNTSGSTTQFSNTAVQSTSSLSLVKLNTITFDKYVNGSINVSYQLSGNSCVDEYETSYDIWAYSRIYKNGISQTGYNNKFGGGYQTFTNTLNNEFNNSDTIEIWASTSDCGNPAYVRNLYVNFSENTSYPLSIQKYSPLSDPFTDQGITQKFYLNLSRTSNTTWYMNGTVVEYDNNTYDPMYSNNSAPSLAAWNVTVTSKQGSSEVSRQWNWTINSTVVPSYMPPTPVNLSNITGNFYVNHTWQAGSGNITDSYNVLMNNSWYNGTSNYLNLSKLPHGWQNITVYAYNSTGDGLKNTTGISQNTQIPNNEPILSSFTNTNYTAGLWLRVQLSVTDADNDTIIYTTNATGNDVSLNSTGSFYWHPDFNNVGNFTWWFNIADGYGGTDNNTETFSLTSYPNPQYTDWYSYENMSTYTTTSLNFVEAINFSFASYNSSYLVFASYDMVGKDEVEVRIVQNDNFMRGITGVHAFDNNFDKSNEGFIKLLNLTTAIQNVSVQFRRPTSGATSGEVERIHIVVWRIPSGYTYSEDDNDYLLTNSETTYMSHQFSALQSNTPYLVVVSTNAPRNGGNNSNIRYYSNGNLQDLIIIKGSGRTPDSGQTWTWTDQHSNTAFWISNYTGTNYINITGSQTGGNVNLSKLRIFTLPLINYTYWYNSTEGQIPVLQSEGEKTIVSQNIVIPSTDNYLIFASNIGSSDISDPYTEQRFYSNNTLSQKQNFYLTDASTEKSFFGINISSLNKNNNFTTSITGFRTGIADYSYYSKSRILILQNPVLSSTITNWGNNYTNNSNLSMELNSSTTILFNVTANTVSDWFWDGATYNSGNGSTASNASRSFIENGNYTVSVTANNTYGSSNTIVWYVNYTTVDSTPPASITSPATTTGNFYINNTWVNPVDADFDHIEFRNLTTNGLLTNLSNTTWNRTLNPHYTQNISAQTVDITGNVNTTKVWFNGTIPNNIPILTNTTNQSVSEGATVFIDINCTDTDSDTCTFSNNQTNNFTDWSSVTGTGNWTTNASSAGIYYIDIGVTDGYGGQSNYTMTITVNNIASTYIPPAPINLANTTGNFWVNHTWESGIGNITNSYNITQNGTWTNGSSNPYFNTTVGAHNWSNITIRAFNNSGSGELSLLNITQNTQIPNNIPSLTNTTNQTVSEDTIIFIDINCTDVDNDTCIFSNNQTNNFTDWSTSLGTGNWTTNSSSSGTYYIDIGVTDGYGGQSNYTMTITVNDVLPNPPNITGWSNTNTSNTTLTLTVQRYTNITFNATSNQTLTSCSWTGATQVNCTSETYAYKNFTSTGVQQVSISGSNVNGSTQTITWTITVIGDSINLEGYVNASFSTGLLGVRVSLDNDAEITYTNSSGYYNFSVDSGTHYLRFNLSRFRTNHSNVTVVSNTIYNISMQISKGQIVSATPGFETIFSAITIMLIYILKRKYKH